LGFDKFGNEIAVIVRGCAFGGIGENVLVLELAFANLDALAYARLKDSGVVLVAEVFGSFASQACALIGHDNQEAPHFEVAIEFALHVTIGFDHAANTIDGERAELHGDDDTRSSSQGIVSKLRERWSTINQHIVECVLYVFAIERLSTEVEVIHIEVVIAKERRQDHLRLHLTMEVRIDVGEVGRSWDIIETLARLIDGQVVFVTIAECIGHGERGVILSMILLHLFTIAEERREIALWIEIDTQDVQAAVAAQEAGSDVLDGGSFGYPTLVVDECQNFF